MCICIPVCTYVYMYTSIQLKKFFFNNFYQIFKYIYTLFALTLCYILLFLSTLHGVYKRDCSCIPVCMYVYMYTCMYVCATVHLSKQHLPLGNAV